MSDLIGRFLNQLKKAHTSALTAKAVSDLLTARTQSELVQRLVEIARAEDRINDEVFGYYIIPILTQYAVKQKGLLPKIKKLVQDQIVPVKFSMHCIGLIDRLYRKHRALSPNRYRTFVQSIAADKNYPDNLRARAARLLTRLPLANQINPLRRLINSNNAELIEAACHTIAWWPDAAFARYGALLDGIIGFVKHSPEKVLDKTNILKTLARSQKPEATVALDAILAVDADENDGYRLSACIGPSTTAKQMGRIVHKVTAKTRPETRMAILNLIRRQPDLLEQLYNAKAYDGLLKVIENAPTALGKPALAYLDKLQKDAGPGTQELARRQKRELESARYNAFLTRERVLAWKRKETADPWNPPLARALRHAASRQEIKDAHCTGLHMGDALYRETHIPDPFTHNHWHAAIFQSFELLRSGAGIEGSMRGVHMTGWPGDVQPFGEVNPNFSRPECDPVVEMKQLYEDFMVAFLVDADHPFHGTRRPPLMSKIDRLNLLNMSESLVNQGIQYTFADMLDWKGTTWSGAVDDIDNLRCDGVVEYTYEACGKKVCAGKEVANWNIAAPGNQHPESHDDLHTWGLDEGELCPKVQAGAEGNDTTFVIPPSSAPIVNEFRVVEERTPSGNVIAVKLNVRSDEYYSVYVRVIVRRKGASSFYFLETDAAEIPSSIAGDWMFREVDEGTNHFAYWQGKTTGPDFHRVNDDYEFRVVAIDMGGNISKEFSLTMPIDWSRLKPPPW